MNRLFWANMVRLWKSKLLGLGILVLAGLAVLLCVDHYRYFRESRMLDDIFFGYVYMAGIPIAILAGLFLGVEYGDGTIRNKLIAGYGRGTVYLANFFAVFSASLIISFSYLAVICALGIPLFGGPKSDWRIIILVFLESILTLGAISAIFTMIGMLWQNKAMSAVICILLAFGLQMLTIAVDADLSHQEFYGPGVYTSGASADGEPELISLEGQPNPYYLQGTKRAVYEFLYDFNPVSQGLQMANLFAKPPKHIGLVPLYSLIIIFGATGGGIYLFGKKDLK